MKIYTKGGDKGATALIGGRRVPKNHPQIEAYGSVDELMAFIAHLRDSIRDEYYRELLFWVLDRLMAASSRLAADGKDYLNALPSIKPEDITRLEKEIDQMEEKLPELHSFILPGGDPLASLCHIARTVCRRAERNCIGAEQELTPDEHIIPFLNRLSDFLFVYSRLIVRELGSNEMLWKPGL